MLAIFLKPLIWRTWSIQINTFVIFFEPLIWRARSARQIKGSKKMASILKNTNHNF